jgi:hypothetical protein
MLIIALAVTDSIRSGDHHPSRELLEDGDGSL